MRNLKTLGLALVAAFALSAVVASAASAETAHFTVQGIGAGETAGVKGTQVGSPTNTFTKNGLTMTCATATVTGKALSTGPEPSTITLEPTYSGCHVVIAGLTKTVTVTMNGCAYIYRATKNTESVAFSADLTIECEVAGPKKIEIHTYSTAGTEVGTTCTTDITPHQTITGTIQLTNEPAATPDDILAHINVTFPVHNTIQGALCGQNAIESTTWHGTFTLQGLKGGSPVHTTIS